MRKFNTIAILVVILFLAGATDTQSKGSIKFGIKAGVNLSNLYADRINSEFKPGFVGGIFARMKSDKIALQSEILYTMKGYRVESLDGKSISLDYIEFPVLLKYYFHGRESINQYLYFGPASAIRVRAKSGEDIISSRTEASAISLILGFGSDFVMKAGELQLELRYTYSLTDTFDENQALVGEGGNNAVISLIVGYLF